MIDTVKAHLRERPLVRRMLDSKFRRWCHYWKGCLIHWYVRHFRERWTDETFTRFMRVPGQYDALTGPVLKFLEPSITGRRLEILVLGCSNGSEPYSIASSLADAHPELDFHILGVDISEAEIEQAKSGRYLSDEILNNEILPDDFIAKTFSPAEPASDAYVVKEALRKRVTFQTGDILDTQLVSRLKKADIVFLQNVMFNMAPKVAERFFDVAYSLMAERSALFLDGADLPQRMRLTRRRGLEPLDYRVREIHEEVMHIHGKGWPNLYWGIEPYWPSRRDSVRRYATVFLKKT